MTSPVLGEFLGTMILVLLGDGVVAGVLLKRSRAEGGGWMVITAGWAFAVMAGVFVSVACGSSGARLADRVHWVHTWWQAWFGGLVFRWAARRATRLTRRVTSGRAWRTQYCQLLGKAAP